MFAYSALTLLFATAAIAQSCSTLPSSITYNNAKLPDPFTFVNGTKVTSKSAWTCRRQEALDLIQRYELGTKPGKPSTFTATFSSNSLKITAGEGGKSISFSASIKLPSSGTAPYPAIIAFGGASIPIPANVAVITYSNEEIAPSDPPHGKGKFFDLYGSNHPAGGLLAWAWGVSRIIDGLETVGAATTKIDPTRVGVTGCSRNGKGALISGAFDDRVALTLPQEGGSGAAGCWRIVAEMKKNGTKVEDATQIVGGDQWFTPDFSKYAPNVDQLPFDHHLLIAAVAPRGLLVIENSGIDYLGPISNYGCSLAGRTVYESLGAKDAMGYTQVAHGSSHCQFPSSQQTELTAFINKFLLKQSATTDVFKTDKSYNYDSKRWADWTTPTLS